MKIRVIHIHSNPLFINDIKRFEGSDFLNTVIVLGKKIKFQNHYSENAIFFKRTPRNINKIICICNKSNLVVLHDLDWVKKKIAISLSSEIMIAWRFYGYELYSLNANTYYTELTKNTEKKVLFKALFQNIFERAFGLVSYIKWGNYLYTDFNKVIKRVNYFLGYSIEEYDYLKKLHPELPPFIKLSIELTGAFSFCKSLSAKSRIVIGNNRSPYNNHLDIIELIKSYNNSENYEFILPFNYGVVTNYSKDVIKAASQCINVKILDKMLSFAEYNNMFNQSQAIIINSHKQMALGNIFIAIQNGLKIYLNKSNEIFLWLRNSGLKIYSIEDFAKDLLSGNIKLSYSDAKENYDKFVLMSTSYNNSHFRGALMKGFGFAISDRTSSSI
jgi:hypothetical protein